MTEKLYYKDQYIKDFYSTVLSSDAYDGAYDTVLDKTAFFPEEGGQYSDTGFIGDSSVTYVYERDGVIHHITDKPLTVGETVYSRLNFDERYEKMQCHTGEHILSGLFHSLYGCTNVGFHLNDTEFTVELDRELAEDEILRVEELANRVIYENVAVTATFPTPDVLATLEYRSKLELTDNVRIVKIGDHDSCACCAPHVSYTGEIGVIKILETMRHRGGSKLFVTAGIRAYRDYSLRCEAVKRVSALTSTPRLEIADAVEKLLSDMEGLRLELKSARRELFMAYADRVEPTEGNAVLYYPSADMDDLRLLANTLIDRVGGILVLLLGEEGDFKYLIVSKSHDLRAMAADINRALLGRGGGKSAAIQGSFSAGLSEIQAYFNK